jgi:hypothetical protein
MLTLLDTGLNHTCQGHSRREFLRIGSLGLAGLSLSGLLSARATAASAKSLIKDKSVVLLFLQGGPPHIEFFDPKMDAPEGVHSINGETQTALPGVTFGSTFTKLAKIAQKLTIVRSYASMNGGHTYEKVVSGNNPTRASGSALYSRIAGATHLTTGIPRSVLILPEAVQPGLKQGGNFETGALPTLTTPGDLGAGYESFNPAGGTQLRKDLELKISRERFDDRRSLLGQLDNYKRQFDKTGLMDGLDAFQRQAYDAILKGVAEAFDLSKEDPKTIEKYDTSKLFEMKEVTKWYDMKRASNLLGKQMLMARRLCEAGCGFVTVSDCGWDYHANGNSPKQMAGLPMMGGQVDHAVSAFIEDVEARGLSDKILLVVTGEMGRTPRLNRDGGRDHWADLTALLLAGGGLKMGQVIGQSDKTAGRPATERYTPANLLATILDTVLDTGEARISLSLPRSVAMAVSDGTPIPGLF